MGTQTDLDIKGDRPGGRGSPGVPVGASRRGLGSALDGSVGGGGSGLFPPPPAPVRINGDVPAAGEGPGREGSASPPLPRGLLRTGTRCRSAPSTPSALPQSPLLWQPQSRHLPLSPFPGSASGQAGDNERGAFSAWWGEDFVIGLLSGFPPDCDPSSLLEFRDPLGEVGSHSSREDTRVYGGSRQHPRRRESGPGPPFWSHG